MLEKWSQKSGKSPGPRLILLFFYIPHNWGGGAKKEKIVFFLEKSRLYKDQTKQCPS